MTYDEWESQVPAELRADTVWKVEAYRLALFLSDLAWQDTAPLFKSRQTIEIADQLRRAASKISASVCEGYSRNTSKVRSTYYEYALGSTRECRDWYYKARHSLKPKVVMHRLDICGQIIRLTLRMISNERRKTRRISDDL